MIIRRRLICAVLGNPPPEGLELWNWSMATAAILYEGRLLQQAFKNMITGLGFYNPVLYIHPEMGTGGLPGQHRFKQQHLSKTGRGQLAVGTSLIGHDRYERPIASDGVVPKSSKTTIIWE
jgi:hypothetical protein